MAKKKNDAPRPRGRPVDKLAMREQANVRLNAQMLKGLLRYSDDAGVSLRSIAIDRMLKDGVINRDDLPASLRDEQSPSPRRR